MSLPPHDSTTLAVIQHADFMNLQSIIQVPRVGEGEYVVQLQLQSSPRKRQLTSEVATLTTDSVVYPKPWMYCPTHHPRKG
jgi:hypothetical protein